MLNSVDVYVGGEDHWTCHVCGRERPDDKISVRKFEVNGPDIARVTVNVRYCNDTPSCYEGATDVSFLKSAQKAFGP